MAEPNELVYGGQAYSPSLRTVPQPYPVILWFRWDLRLADNPALTAAAATEAPVIPVYIWDEAEGGRWTPGAAQRWWLHHSLAALDRTLAARGLRLVLRKGPAAAALQGLLTETGAKAIYANRCYEPWAMRRDDALKTDFGRQGVAFELLPGNLLFEPGTVLSRTGTPLRVFTPFWRACLAAPSPLAPLPVPRRITLPRHFPRSDALASWSLTPRKPDWSGGLAETWQPGEDAAAERLTRFLEADMAAYATARDRLDLAGTSRLSPHLRFGEISPRQIWHAVRHRLEAGGSDTGATTLLRELGWREFSYHLLFHFPDMPEKSLRAEFAAFPWRKNVRLLAAWQKGRTGYPIVDAGMRELWATGWMHNRARMIAASFLVKHLLQPWQEGAAWFWDTLVDGDLANNSASWQWVAGCGSDAAPFFRIFNPVLQGEKFDPKGAYVRRWVPELAALPDDFIHQPWTAPKDALRAAGITLGRDYPPPIVEHSQARERALTAWKTLRQRTKA